MAKNPLGRPSSIPEKYAPEILYPIPRWPSRSLLDIDKKIPLHGFDCWRAYELSWLDNNGLPRVAMGEFYFDAKSENIIESKSLKLYLNSLNNEKFSSQEQFAETIARDLKGVTRSEVRVTIKNLNDDSLRSLDVMPGRCIDIGKVVIESTDKAAGLLVTQDGDAREETVCSNLFRSNCPITGQPDWASVMVSYRGAGISHDSLLSYICSFRNHQGYHEECAELMFRDIMLHCEPEKLVVGLNFTRRGGLEINPYRSNNPISPEDLTFRLVRQ